MEQTFKQHAKPLRTTTALLLTLSLLISMTACSPRLVAVPEGETIQVKKGTLDNLYRDNELLMKALTDCKAGKK
jgi:hypothetical protein